MDKEQNRNQIVRKDAKGCFVEILNDAFGLGKIHLVFSAYDLGRPAGQRQTNMIPIYIDIGEFLELCRKLNSGELRYLVQAKKSRSDTTPLFQVLGGTSVQRLAQQGRARADGKSLSRVFQLICGAKTDFLLVASSGPGDTNEKGLIVPRFGNHPENHVTVSMTFEAFSELLLMTKEHYTAWLTSRYIGDGAGRARTISAPVQTFQRGTDESELKPIAGPFSPGHIF